ncbi:MAG: murein L,D-transpeptidase catalytic domain family protein [Candidatus Binatia bacterium]
MLDRRMWLVALLACLLPSCARAPLPRPARPPVRLADLTETRSRWPRREVLDLAMQAYSCGRNLGVLDERPLLTVIDYSLPSSQRRLWVIDLARRRVLFNELVAHGANSGDAVATAFSNTLGSRQSSLGLFRTAAPYIGQHGRSMRLVGLEPGINDRAEERAIVMHGASYVSAAHVRTYGRIGRSWGCPALPQDVNDQVIDRIQNGTALFAYYPDRDWLRSSRFLHCDGRVAAR